MSLENVQIKFAAIIIPLAEKPRILSQFAMWLDLLLAEYKIKGVINPECSGAALDPVWLRGHKRKVKGKKPRNVTLDKHRQTAETAATESTNSSTQSPVTKARNLFSRHQNAATVTAHFVAKQTNSAPKAEPSVTKLIWPLVRIAPKDSNNKSTTTVLITKSAEDALRKKANTGSVEIPQLNLVANSLPNVDGKDGSRLKSFKPISPRLCEINSKKRPAAETIHPPSLSETGHGHTVAKFLKIVDVKTVKPDSASGDDSSAMDTGVESRRVDDNVLTPVHISPAGPEIKVKPPEVDHIYKAEVSSVDHHSPVTPLTGNVRKELGDHMITSPLQFVIEIEPPEVEDETCVQPDDLSPVTPLTGNIREELGDHMITSPLQFVIKTEPPEVEDQTCVTPAIKTVTQPGSPTAESSDRPNTSTLQYVIKTEPPEFVDHSPIRHGANSTKPFLA